jgi:hypothetical protein
MSGYVGRNCYITPNYLHHGSDQPPWMDALLTRENSRYADFNANSCLGLTEEELFLRAREQRALFSHASNVSFYRDEYNALLLEVERQIPGIRTKHALEKLHNVSELMDEALYDQQQTSEMALDSVLRKTPYLFNIDDMLSWKQTQDRKHALFMMHEQSMCDIEDEEFILKSMTNIPKRFKYTEPMKRLKRNATLTGSKTSAKAKPQPAENNQKERKPDC